MADSYPYISGAGNIVQAVTHFRKSFPVTVTADTLKKLGIAPNNESYVINTLRFIKVLDAEGKKTSQATHHIADCRLPISEWVTVSTVTR